METDFQLCYGRFSRHKIHASKKKRETGIEMGKRERKSESGAIEEKGKLRRYRKKMSGKGEEKR